MSAAERGDTRPQAAGLALPPTAWAPWDGSPLPASDTLRWGFTTGACAAGVLAASFLDLLHGGTGTRESVDLLFNDGIVRTLPLAAPLPGRPGHAVIRKNAGDDPDCTHGALVFGAVTKARDGDGAAAPGPHDYELFPGRARVTLRCVEGVGLATREGLDCERGHWAVNRGVRAMITANLERAGCTEGRFLAEVGVADGEALARRTLNPALGIAGGLSLLGTSGLVRPFSNEAYVATIRVCARANAEARCRTLVLCTGGRTRRGAARWSKGAGLAVTGPLPDTAFVAMADFVGEAVRAAAGSGMRRVIACCMPGKLLKYAAGLDNTHAHRTAQDLPALGRLVDGLVPAGSGLAEAVAQAATVREALGLLPDGLQARILGLLARQALANFPKLLGEGDGAAPGFALLLMDGEGRPLGFHADARFLAAPAEGGQASGHAGEGTQA